ncbi:hypothetical protein [Arthrobacter sp. D2-10]
MAGADYTHPNQVIRYEKPSPAEEALTTSAPAHGAGIGPVNFTWANPDPRIRRHL